MSVGTTSVNPTLIRSTTTTTVLERPPLVARPVWRCRGWMGGLRMHVPFCWCSSSGAAADPETSPRRTLTWAGSSHTHRGAVRHSRPEPESDSRSPSYLSTRKLTGTQHARARVGQSLGFLPLHAYTDLGRVHTHRGDSTPQQARARARARVRVAHLPAYPRVH